MLIDRAYRCRARRLNDEHVSSTDVLVDLERHLCIGEPSKARLPKRHAQKAGNLPGELWMGAPSEDLQLTETGCHQEFTYHLQPLAFRVGWGGRIRTFEYGIQSPAPYRLATPHYDDAGGESPLHARLASVSQPAGEIGKADPQEWR